MHNAFTLGVYVSIHVYTLFCKAFENWASKWMLGLKMGFGLRLSFLGHILGFIKSLGSTHDTNHFGTDLILVIGIRGIGYRLEQDGMSTLLLPNFDHHPTSPT